MKLNFLFAFGLLIVLFSCKSEDKKNDAKVKEEKVVNELTLKYKAGSISDTTAAYTSFYQETFISQRKLMLFKGRIYDIVKGDSNYVIKVMDERENAYQNFLAIINFTYQQYDAFTIDTKSDAGIFVIQVSKVSTSNPSIKVDERNSGDDSYSYKHLSDDKDQMLTIFTGNLVDYRLKELDNSY